MVTQSATASYANGLRAMARNYMRRRCLNMQCVLEHLRALAAVVPFGGIDGGFNQQGADNGPRARSMRRAGLRRCKAVSKGTKTLAIDEDLLRHVAIAESLVICCTNKLCS